MRLTRIHIIIFALLTISFILFLPSTIIFAQATSKQAETQIKFVEIGRWPTHTIEVAGNTISEEVSKTGEIIRGAAFRVTASEPFDVENLKISSMIHIVITKCGTNTILITNTMMFDVKGKLVKQTEPMASVKNGAPTDSNTFVYFFLCSGVENKKLDSYNPKLV
jgi:hypothetical protein